MSSIGTFHSTSSTSSFSTPRNVPLTELPDTAQIVLSQKPRLINVTHQIPYACTVINRDNHLANAQSPVSTPGGGTGGGSPQYRRSSLAVPRQGSVSSSSSLLDQNAGEPAEATLENGDCILEQRRGHSAMYSGIRSLRQDLETIQIGWVGELADQDGYVVPFKSLNNEQKQNLRDKLWEKEKVVPIFLDDKRAAVLWPLFHYILWDEATDGRIEKKSWDDYVFVNQQFADTIAEQYQPGDI
ncbi:threalose-6-phosphate phosphatase, partial [Lunasporangiospora selenospora]